MVLVMAVATMHSSIIMTLTIPTTPATPTSSGDGTGCRNGNGGGGAGSSAMTFHKTGGCSSGINDSANRNRNSSRGVVLLVAP